MEHVIKGDISVDDRGFVRYVNDFDFSRVKRFYQVSNHEKNFIRAWHGHKKEQKYVYVSKGSIKLGLVNLDSERVSVFYLSDKKPQIIYIPENFANGFMTLEEDTDVIFYSSSTLEESLSDDYRFSFDKWNIWEKKYR